MVLKEELKCNQQAFPPEPMSDEDNPDRVRYSCPDKSCGTDYLQVKDDPDGKKIFECEDCGEEYEGWFEDGQARIINVNDSDWKG